MFTDHRSTLAKRIAFRHMLADPDMFPLAACSLPHLSLVERYIGAPSRVMAAVIMSGMAFYMLNYILMSPLTSLGLRVAWTALYGWIIMFSMILLTSSLRRWLRASRFGTGYVIGCMRSYYWDEPVYQWPERALPGYFYRNTTGVVISVV